MVLLCEMRSRLLRYFERANRRARLAVLELSQPHVVKLLSHAPHIEHHGWERSRNGLHQTFEVVADHPIEHSAATREYRLQILQDVLHRIDALRFQVAAGMTQDTFGVDLIGGLDVNVGVVTHGRSVAERMK